MDLSLPLLAGVFDSFEWQLAINVAVSAVLGRIGLTAIANQAASRVQPETARRG